MIRSFKCLDIGTEAKCLTAAVSDPWYGLSIGPFLQRLLASSKFRVHPPIDRSVASQDTFESRLQEAPRQDFERLPCLEFLRNSETQDQLKQISIPVLGDDAWFLARNRTTEQDIVVLFRATWTQQRLQQFCHICARHETLLLLTPPEAGNLDAFSIRTHDRGRDRPAGDTCILTRRKQALTSSGDHAFVTAARFPSE